MKEILQVIANGYLFSAGIMALFVAAWCVWVYVRRTNRIEKPEKLKEEEDRGLRIKVEVEEIYSAAYRCYHCHEPLIAPIGQIQKQAILEVYYQGKLHRFHDDCWTAREVAERLSPPKSKYYNNVIFSDDEYRKIFQETEDKVFQLDLRKSIWAEESGSSRP